MSYARYPYQAGGIGSFLGKAARAVVGGVTGFITGGPVGAVVGAGGALIGKGTGTKAGMIGGTVGAVTQSFPVSMTPPGDGFNIGPININPMGILPGGEPFIGPSTAQGKVSCPVGYHPNKQGGPKGPAGSYCVRNRSMNPANGRAIGRAATRIKKGAKQYARVLRVLGKKTGRMVPRGRKRS